MAPLSAARENQTELFEKSVVVFSSQRLSQNLQTIEAFEEMPGGRVCCRPSVGSGDSESTSRFPTASRAFAAWAKKERETIHFKICSRYSHCLVLASRAPSTDCQVWATTLVCHFMWKPCLKALSMDFFELTTWDKFERGLVRWSDLIVSDSCGCWCLQHKERAITTSSLDTE